MTRTNKKTEIATTATPTLATPVAEKVKTTKKTKKYTANFLIKDIDYFTKSNLIID